MADLPVIGIIAAGGAGPIESFTTGLAEWGYVAGQNIRLERRMANGDLRRLPVFAKELVGSKVDLVAAIGAVTVRAVRNATPNIPIVYSVVIDPVRDALAKSMRQPGVNMTGVTTFARRQAPMNVQLLSAVLPNLARIAILSNKGVSDCLSDANARATIDSGRRPQVLRIDGPNPDLKYAFSAMEREQAEALIVLEQPINGAQSSRIARLANERGMPTVFAREQSDADGLFSYGTSLRSAAHRMASHAMRILHGNRPEELPVETLSREELVVNLRTARALGLTVAPQILARATQVIE